MGIYRAKRNYEKSIIDYLTNAFNQSGGFTNFTIEKTFKKVNGTNIDSNTGAFAVCVRALTTRHDKVEIGANSTFRIVSIAIDIFATDDGQREDVSDYIVEFIKQGCPYFQYTTSGNSVTSKVLSGYIRCLGIEDNPVNFNVPKNQLEVVDRYRHIIVARMSTSIVEV